MNELEVRTAISFGKLFTCNQVVCHCLRVQFPRCQAPKTNHAHINKITCSAWSALDRRLSAPRRHDQGGGRLGNGLVSN